MLRPARLRQERSMSDTPPDPPTGPDQPPPEPAPEPSAGDWDEDLYQATCAVLDAPETNTTAWKTLTILVVSGVLFGLAAAPFTAGRTLVTAMGVLLVHELGHLLAMRWFGYRNIQMFFIPFFGAAVTGTRHAAPVWQQVVVVLMGPLPGLAAGLLATVLWHPDRDTWLGAVVFWLVLVNGLNLLPFVPLDGGRVLDLLLFGRQPWLAVGFRVLAVVGLGAVAWMSQSCCVGTLAGFLLLGLPFRYRKARQERSFRGNPLGLPETLEALDDAHRRELFGWARLLNPLDRGPTSLAADVRNLHECMVSRPPGFWGRVGLLVPYVLGLAATVAGIVLFTLDDEVRAARTAEELAGTFAGTVDAVRDLRNRAKQHEEAAAGQEAARLRAEADEKWAGLVAEWKREPLGVQIEALRRVVQAEAATGRAERIREVRQLMNELDLEKKLEDLEKKLAPDP
jgi:Zn-dependent protease